MSELPNFF